MTLCTLQISSEKCLSDSPDGLFTLKFTRKYEPRRRTSSSISAIYCEQFMDELIPWLIGVHRLEKVLLPIC